MTNEEIAELFAGFESDDERVLSERLSRGQRAFRRLKLDGLDERANELREASRGPMQRLSRIKDDRLLRKVCPMSWPLEDPAAAAKALHPTLRKLVEQEAPYARSVLMMGPTKAGKSTAATLMLSASASDLRRKHETPRHSKAETYDSNMTWSSVRIPPVSWVYARALAQCSKYHPLGEGEPELITQCRMTNLLILDDLGLERDPGDIVDVVHERYEQGRVTWTTTGLSLVELNQRYGEAFVRRLTEGRSQPGWRVDLFPKADAA